MLKKKIDLFTRAMDQAAIIYQIMRSRLQKVYENFVHKLGNYYNRLLLRGAVNLAGVAAAFPDPPMN